MREIVYAKKDIATVANKLSALINQYTIFAFIGSLGAGKTTFIGALLKQLGVVEQVTSPTFTYMQIYTLADSRMVYHFDLYRIDSIESFMRAGFEEYLFQQDSLVFIEWPEIIMPLIEHEACVIEIAYKDEKSRILRFGEAIDNQNG